MAIEGLVKVYDYVWDPAGNVIPGVVVSLEKNGVPVTLYQDEDGNLPIGQVITAPLSAPTPGYYEFFVPPDVYDIKYVKDNALLLINYSVTVSGLNDVPEDSIVSFPEAVLSGEAISSGRLVKIVSGVARLTGADDDEVLTAELGVSVNAVSGAGEALRLVHLGIVSDTSFNFTPGTVYAGTQGQLVQVDPGEPAHFVIAGYSKGGTRFVFNPSTRIKRN